ncbi:MAG: hypothetical protein N3D16_06770, partial [Anaerolineales bacterium]|nr:hypothetical protein [Anaerolineales bacterium]
MGLEIPFHINLLLSLFLFFYLFLVSMGVGYFLVNRISNKFSLGDQTLLTITLGFAVVAYGILFLGLIGALNRLVISFWLLGLGVIALPKGITISVSLLGKFRQYIKTPFSTLIPFVQQAIVLVIIIWVLSLWMALTPPWDYDGLMYHLEGPRQFLKAGRILLLPDNWGANSPSIGAMLYSIGLVYNVDLFPKILHWFYGLLYCLLTFRLGIRFYDKASGILALLILCGIPNLPFLASWTYVDLFWSVYDVLAFYCLFLWINDAEKQNERLLVGGVMMGLALATKYLALMSAVVAIFLLIWKIEQKKLLIKRISFFSLPALLIASPWYLKNLILGGNPIYPLIIGGMEWPLERWQLLADHLYSYGVGYSLRDFILLPINLFTKTKEFVTFGGYLDIPNPLFLFLLLYPFLHKKLSNFSRLLIVIIFIRLCFWFLGSQQTRFLYPIFPLLSIVTSKILIELNSALLKFTGYRKIRRIVY